MNDQIPPTTFESTIRPKTRVKQNLFDRIIRSRKRIITVPGLSWESMGSVYTDGFYDDVGSAPLTSMTSNFAVEPQGPECIVLRKERTANGSWTGNWEYSTIVDISQGS
jgi:hypothetical protein